MSPKRVVIAVMVEADGHQLEALVEAITATIRGRQVTVVAPTAQASSPRSVAITVGLPGHGPLGLVRLYP